MTLEQVTSHYGYIVILLGALIEGETILLLGGIAAKLGYLSLPNVIACAFTGSLIGDQLSFLAGRYRGVALLRSHPSWRKRARKAAVILERHRIIIIIGFRFLYGLRIITPFVIGMSRVPMLEFAILNITGAAIWATLVVCLGYAFGHAMELWLGDIHRYEMVLLATVFIAGLLVWLVYMARNKRHQE